MIMIEISKLTETDKGRVVRYQAQTRVEYGVIRSWNDRFIFVRYFVNFSIGKEIRRSGETAESTHPNDLEFV